MSVIGSSPARAGAVERVTGSQQYAADLRLENALHVKLASLACAHAKILSIDTAEAARTPGVRRVLTADDLPDPMPRYGPAHAEPRYHVDPAALAAEVARIAAEGSEAVHG